MVHVELVQAQLVGQDVLHVVVHHTVGAEAFFLIPIQDAGGAGHARAHGQDLALQRLRPGLGDLGHLGARTDEAHLADQHVPQLGQFVQLGIAQPLPQRSDASVVPPGDGRTLITGGFFAHGAELEDLEGTPAHAHARTAVKDGTGRIAFDHSPQQEEEGREQEQSEPGGDDIHEALEEVREPARQRKFLRRDGHQGIDRNSVVFHGINP